MSHFWKGFKRGAWPAFMVTCLGYFAMEAGADAARHNKAGAVIHLIFALLYAWLIFEAMTDYQEIARLAMRLDVLVTTQEPR